MINLENNHITYAIDNSMRLTLTIYKYLSEERKYIDEIVKLYLEKTNLQHMTNQLTYCIHELAGNACKANTKRSYFKKMNLNIEDDDQYQEGMKSFREDVYTDMEKFHDTTKQSGYYIKFQIKRSQDTIDLSILNNTVLTPKEESKIQEKFEAVKDYENVAEAFANLEDASEGAGLGIAMMVIMLKEMGLPPENLRIFTADNETHAVLNLPLQSQATLAQ